MNQSQIDANLTLSSHAPSLSNRTYDTDLDGLKFLLLTVEISRYFFAFNFCIGLFGNSVSFIVLGRRTYKNSTNAINLRFLSVFDMICLLLSLSFALSSSSNHGSKPFCLFFDYVFNMANDMSNWTLVVLTIQRVTGVLMPHRVGLFFTPKKNYYIILGITLFMLIVDAQDIFLMNHVIMTRCTITYPSYLSKVKVIFDWFNITKLFFLPFLIIVIGNTIMMYNLHQRKKFTTNLSGAGPKRKISSTPTMSTTNSKCRTNTDKESGDAEKVDPESRRTTETDYDNAVPQLDNSKHSQVKPNVSSAQRSTKRARQDRSVTVILIMLNIFFVIFKLPHEIQFIYYGIPPPPPTYRQNGEKYLIGMVSLCHNSSNFYLYVLFGSKFRQELKDLFREMVNGCSRKFGKRN